MSRATLKIIPGMALVLCRIEWQKHNGRHGESLDRRFLPAFDCLDSLDVLRGDRGLAHRSLPFATRQRVTYRKLESRHFDVKLQELVTPALRPGPAFAIEELARPARICRCYCRGGTQQPNLGPHNGPPRPGVTHSPSKYDYYLKSVGVCLVHVCSALLFGGSRWCSVCRLGWLSLAHLRAPSPAFPLSLLSLGARSPTGSLR
ncbi:hypothetical protein F5B19DRAFT_397802 [Rostrohypoxylon terebratum]|nr:hypothetical protein F5B19DRAFT_397802 [Rostrohypoxylon terebratum]